MRACTRQGLGQSATSLRAAAQSICVCGRRHCACTCRARLREAQSARHVHARTSCGGVIHSRGGMCATRLLSRRARPGVAAVSPSPPGSEPRASASARCSPCRRALVAADSGWQQPGHHHPRCRAALVFCLVPQRRRLSVPEARAPQPDKIPMRFDVSSSTVESTFRNFATARWPLPPSTLTCTGLAVETFFAERF